MVSELAGDASVLPFEQLLFRTYFPRAVYDCGNEIEPGVNEAPQWRDWTGRPTTAGEQRIETFLAQALTEGAQVLHIGVGNSSLAARFSSDFEFCLGISIDEEEVRHAASLKIPNYSVLLLNKFSRDYASIAFQADWIVDSNPTTFACCFKHFCRMMTAYHAQLRPGGSILTEAKGLRSVSSANAAPEPWRLTPQEWMAVSASFGLVTHSPDGSVLVSTKPSG